MFADQFRKFVRHVERYHNTIESPIDTTAKQSVLCSLPERLSFLRGVVTIQPDFILGLACEDSNGVTVGNAYKFLITTNLQHASIIVEE